MLLTLVWIIGVFILCLLNTFHKDSKKKIEGWLLIIVLILIRIAGSLG